MKISRIIFIFNINKKKKFPWYKTIVFIFNFFFALLHKFTSYSLFNIISIFLYSKYLIAFAIFIFFFEFSQIFIDLRFEGKKDFLLLHPIKYKSINGYLRKFSKCKKLNISLPPTMPILCFRYPILIIYRSKIELYFGWFKQIG